MAVGLLGTRLLANSPVVALVTRKRRVGGLVEETLDELVTTTASAAGAAGRGDLGDGDRAGGDGSAHAGVVHGSTMADEHVGEPLESSSEGILTRSVGHVDGA